MTLQPRYVVRTLAALAAFAVILSMIPGERTTASVRKSAGQPLATVTKAARHAAALEREREARHGAGPRQLGGHEPVGRDRVVVPAIPPPIAAPGGGVYVPRSLAEIPCFEDPGPVADD